MKGLFYCFILGSVSHLLLACAPVVESVGTELPPPPEVPAGSHLVFAVTQQTNGDPITGSMGGIERADQICTEWAAVRQVEGDFKALLSAGKPLFDGHSEGDEIHASDRLNLSSGSLVTIDADNQLKTILERASDLWSSCSNRLNESLSVDVANQPLPTETIFWSGTHCDGTAAYFHCNRWTQPGVSVISDDAIVDNQTQYFIHQLAGRVGRPDLLLVDDPMMITDCGREGGLVCIQTR
jgi:hypothetical protein